MGCNCNKNIDEDNYNVDEVYLEDVNQETTVDITRKNLTPAPIQNDNDSISKNDNFLLNSTNTEIHPSMENYEDSILRNRKKIKIITSKLYSEEVLKFINIARNKPLSFCKNIDSCISLITTNYEGQLVLGNEKTNKIALKEGISKFNECKRFMIQLDPIDELVLDKELEIEISNNSDLWLNNEYIKSKIAEKQKNLINSNSKYNIFGFHFDYGMNDPFLSSVLQLVDDNNCEDRRRYNILNSSFKSVGITNKSIGNKFVSYFLFAG